MKPLIVTVAAVALVASACSGMPFVEEVTIVNDTDYSANVDVTDGTRQGWLRLRSVQPRSTTTVESVIDQGEVWIFRFDYVGKHQQQVEVLRRELEDNDWTIEVPQSFEQRLRDLGVPPPP